MQAVNLVGFGFSSVVQNHGSKKRYFFQTNLGIPPTFFHMQMIRVVEKTFCGATVESDLQNQIPAQIKIGGWNKTEGTLVIGKGK